MINPSGDISIATTPEEFGGVVAPNRIVKSARQLVTLPAEKTLYKLIVSTKNIDLTFLENFIITRNVRDREINSLNEPLALLMGQAYFGFTRDAAAKGSIQTFDDWTTIDVEIIVEQ